MTTERNLPAGWRVRRFGEIAESITERVDNPSCSGLDYYVGLEHLDPDTPKITRWGSPSDVEATKLRFYPGDVIYARRRAYQRKLGVAEWDGIASAHALVLRARPEVCLPEFLPYFLQSDQFHRRALDISVGSLSPTINWKTLAIQNFTVPPVSEQQPIVEVLGAADGTAASYGAISGAIDAQRDAAAAQIWRASADERELSSFANVTVGIVVKPAALYVESGGVPALRSLNVLPGRIVEEDVVQISVEGHDGHKKSRLCGGDVVVVRTGRPGDAAVVPDDGVERNAIDLLIVRCGPELPPEYLTCFLNSARGRAQMLGRSAGTAQQHLNAGQLAQVRIPVVSGQAQDQVVRLVEASQEFAAQVAATEARLASVRRSLRERLLQGGVS